MQKLLVDENPDLSLAAYDWLARTSDDRATTILISKLENRTSSDNERGLAAEALGHRREVSALRAIRHTAANYVPTTKDLSGLHRHVLRMEIGDPAVRLLVRLAIAESELGGNELAGIPVVLAHSDVISGRDPIVRIEAVAALASVAGPGMLNVLRNVLLEETGEVAERAVRPLQLLGARQAVDTLIEATAPEKLALAELALTAVVAVTGAGPGMNRSVFDLQSHELQMWWKKERLQFRPDTCYRVGKPLSVATLIDLLRDPQQRAYVAEELRIITGFDCGYDDDLPAESQDAVFYAAMRWFDSAVASYKVGSLYKFGYERNLSDALHGSLTS
jgi:hypothetical protein